MMRKVVGAKPMQDFSGKIAVVTGGGSGMGRELVRQLAAEGCNVAMCDVSARGMAETHRLCEAAGWPQGLRITSHVADVSSEPDVLRFREETASQHATDHIHLLFNNAGVSGGGSMIVNDRDEWERTFNICWGGVYLNTRAFLPMLRAADEAHLVNTSSINGFWASVGPEVPHTAYSAAKFAVKGFTEALIADFRMNAPHIKVSVVMPGHIGTGIRVNSLKVQANNDSDELNATQIAQTRARLASMGKDAAAMSDAEIKAMLAERARRFVTDAPTSAADAATIILDGVKADRLRILVGADAHLIDERVRRDPDHAYDEEFFASFATDAGWFTGR
jgi:NAD(P)-dependent dehydrogenase (short-subunit alcohol dehydrogenase family)